MSATVSELLDRAKVEIGEYKTNKNPSLLQEIKNCLQEAQQALWHSIKFTKDQDTKRLKAIKRHQKEIDALKKGVSVL
jgi:uncharacterized protein Yka (UPF0111/DUF47 family)